MKKPKPNKSSCVIPVRISREQLEQIQSNIPEGVSLSALARTLFAAYLDGSLPESFLERLYNEVARTNLAVKSKQQSFATARRAASKEHKEDGRKQQSSLPPLRERIFLSFARERSSSDSM